ncbi:MAG: hypothetical protein ACKKMS_00840 [Candidatus Nealsonbacteria bacterium]
MGRVKPSRRKRFNSIKRSLLRSKRKAGRIKYLFYQIGLKKGKASAQKVFQVLELWQKQEWIWCFGKYPGWRYHDYILHQDGWFLSLEGEQVDFQIKSSLQAAQKHLEKYPDVPSIVVSPGISIDELSEEMRKLFKDKLLVKSYK